MNKFFKDLLVSIVEHMQFFTGTIYSELSGKQSLDKLTIEMFSWILPTFVTPIFTL